MNINFRLYSHTSSKEDTKYCIYGHHRRGSTVNKLNYTLKWILLLFTEQEFQLLLHFRYRTHLCLGECRKILVIKNKYIVSSVQI